MSVGKTEITTGMDLGAILDGVLPTRITGDIDALFYLWQGVEDKQLTRRLVEREAARLLERGRSLVAQTADDATAIVFALFAASRREVQDIAHGYPNQDSALIRAILDPSDPENA